MPLEIQYANVAAATRTPQTTTTNGNVFVSSTDPKYGNGSGSFGGATSISIDNGNLLLNATTQKTLEFWIKTSNSSVRVYTSMGNFANSAATSWWQLYSQSSNRLELGRAGAAVTVSPTNTYFANGAWQHFAWTINGANNTWYVNGNNIHTFTRTASEWTTSSNVMAFGAQNPTNQGLVGNFDEIRVSDIVRYSANFTPPAGPFTNDGNTQLLLHCDGANGTTTFSDDNISTIQGGITVDYSNVTTATRTAQTTSASGNVTTSTTQVKIGNAALRTAGDNSYVKINAASSLNIGTSNVTIEGWHYPVSKPSGFPTTISNFNYADSGTNTTNDWCLQWSRNSNLNKFAFCLNNVTLTDAWLFSANTFAANNWYHYAIVRAGNTWNMYIDGNLQASNTFSGSLDGNANKNLYTNQNGAGGAVWFNGFLDEIRISNTARYTANFTPQTTPFVNDSNTLLLLHCDGANGANSFPDDNTNTVQGGVTITY